MHCNAFDMLFVAVSQDKENKEETPAESDGNSKGKDAAEKGLTAKLSICLMVVFHLSLVASFGLHHCWSSSGDGWDLGNISFWVKMNLTLFNCIFHCLLTLMMN